MSNVFLLIPGRGSVVFRDNRFSQLSYSCGLLPFYGQLDAWSLACIRLTFWIAWLKGLSYYVNTALVWFPVEESSLKGECPHWMVQL